MDLSRTSIQSFAAGSSENVVPNFAEMAMRCTAREAAQLMALKELDVTFANGVAVIRAEGISSHAAFPENSENAIYKLVAALEGATFLDECTSMVLRNIRELSYGYLGEKTGISADENFFGPLTAVTGMAWTEGNKLTITMNIRYPISTDGGIIRRQLDVFCHERNIEMVLFNDDAPAYVAPDSPEAVLLNELCCEVLDAEFAPYSMGGGTYARKLPRGMSCGPLNKLLQRPGGTSRGGGHQHDECICLESLENLIKIYVRAIVGIDQMI